MSTPFHDLEEYMAIPRVSELCLSPDGGRLVVTVRELTSDRKKWIPALWEIDPRGTTQPRRLTRSTEGESGTAFLPDGSLLFVSGRPDPEARPNEETTAALWLLPESGEAYRVAARPGGVGGLAVARAAGTVVYGADTMPDGDEGRRKRRADTGVTAILHESHPIRAWDHDLGPGVRRLFEATTPPVDDPERSTSVDEGRCLVPDDPGRALDDQAFAVTPDGTTVITGWTVPEPRGLRRSKLVAIDVATGGRRTLASADGYGFHTPAVAPDGRHAVCVRDLLPTPERAHDGTLWLVPLDGGEGHDLFPTLDLWPDKPVWAPDSQAVYFTADERGRAPVFRVDVASGEYVRLTEDDAAYADLAPSPDGRYVFALRVGIAEPPTPVRIDAATGEAVRLPAPGLPLPIPGRVVEVTAAADDGVDIRGWLVLPEGEAPAPLLLWPHGGPYMSWNGWNWRWSHWVMAAHGYAVLLPDPALSTGYGREFVQRGWGSWGPRVAADLKAITEEVAARPDIDDTQVAAMGGSFGGYMANWLAGHTDRFKAIVTHASLWGLRSMFAGTDEAHWAILEFGDPDEYAKRWEANDPARYASEIRTPMLVIHGDKDYRVPIGNALWLWWDLIRHEVDAKFLYFPDENHWIVTPGNATVWYETVLAFLDHHVRGRAWKRPELL